MAAGGEAGVDQGAWSVWGKTRYFIAGGAPLGMDTAGWFADAGLRILEGYGLTETSPVIALNKPGAYRIGSVGKPLPNMECRLASDGELEVRGPSVFMGLLAEAGGDGGDFHFGRVVQDRRHCADRRRRISLYYRPEEGVAEDFGRKVCCSAADREQAEGEPAGGAGSAGWDKHQFISALISPNFAALASWAKEKGIDASDRLL